MEDDRDKKANFITHSALWTSVDNLARRLGKSRSALAKDCGLDSTTFNPSRRHDKYGKKRWLSGRTVSKILNRYNLSPAEFFCLEESEFQ